jgi:predicted MFS family arabinose efflux permease
MLNLVPIMRSTGLSAASAAFVFGFVGIATIVGRVIAGGLIDKFRAGIIAATAAALMTALPATFLLFPGSVAASFIGVFVYGLMGGAMMPCVAYLASRHLGQRAFGTLYATIMAAMSIGVGLGPLLANYVYDRVQSYDPVLWGAIPLYAIGALLFLSLGAYPVFTSEERAA